jgi:tetratricopeptide (TPR) repeat protein
MRNQLLEIARLADPGPWTDRLRNPVTRGDAKALATLAEDADPNTISPVTLSALAVLMSQHNLNPVSLLTLARTRHPTNFELAFVHGLWVSSSDKPHEAIGPYEAARALRPDNLSVLNNLGLVLLDRRDVDASIAIFSEMIRLDEEVADHHALLGHALVEKGDKDGAVRAWKVALKLNPKDAKLHTQLGLEYLKQQKVTAAVACARAAIRVNHTFSDAHALLGAALLELGDLSGARGALTEAARLEPKKWASVLEEFPPIPVAPPPREVKRP